MLTPRQTVGMQVVPAGHGDSNRVAALSILVNALLATGKIIFGILSSSAAVMAEGAHSFMDVVSSVVSYIGIRASLKPEDREHPYGHYKYEVLTGTIVTLILFVTGICIVYEAYRRAINPARLTVGLPVYGVMVVSMIANEVMARLKMHVGKKERSIGLIADGLHSRVDAFASLALLAGLVLTRYWVYGDSLLTLLIGLYVTKESITLGWSAIGSLLDASAGEVIDREIRKIAEAYSIVLESLITQKKGSAVTGNLEILLPSNLTVEEATGILNRFRKALLSGIEGLRYVAIQIKSHKVETGFYKPVLGRGFGWQRNNASSVHTTDAGRPSAGWCVCPQCGHRMQHPRGTPCSTLKCPACNEDMRKESTGEHE